MTKVITLIDISDRKIIAKQVMAEPGQDVICVMSPRYYKYEQHGTLTASTLSFSKLENTPGRMYADGEEIYVMIKGYQDADADLAEQYQEHLNDH